MQESVPMEVNHSNVAAQREESANMSDNIADGFVMLDNQDVNQVISDDAQEIGEGDDAEHVAESTKPKFGPLASKILAPSILGINKSAGQNQSMIPQNFDTHV